MKQSTRKVLITLGVIVVLALVGVYIAQKDNVIEIKYSGNEVNLSGYDSLNTSKSSFVHGAWYDSAGKTLVLKLNDDYYQYCNFPDDVWLDFSDAESFGQFYNSTIKDHYQCSESGESSGDSTNTSTGIESSPYYEVCLSEAADKGNTFLSSHGYTENEDGSWTDINGDYPTPEFENNELEIYQTGIFNNCLESHGS